ncbi:kinase-like domain-containing protein [Russula aff. rugulosa BPL654]|nr:kinase-like domain-containing protein [Russula aff. rugulosa BPL654]
MLFAKLRSHVQSLVHFRARSVERVVSPVSAKPANDNPRHDDYDILRMLSVGEDTAVYLVREKNTTLLYALKVIDKRGRDVSTILNEQAALAKLSGSDFILHFVDASRYRVLEYIPGGDLKGMQEFVELNVGAVQFYMAELLLAIEHVHAHNIIHGDIKQENDCSSETDLTRGRVVTPAFSCREVALDHEYGFETDLWAFGVMLHKLLSDESPLMTEDAVDLVSQLLRKDRDSRLSDITEIKKHPFFGRNNWERVASRSLKVPWVPRLVSTREAGIGFRKPHIFVGDPYTAGNDPLPSFTFRVASSSLSRSCERRQEVLSKLEGHAALIMWFEGQNSGESERIGSNVFESDRIV